MSDEPWQVTAVQAGWLPPPRPAAFRARSDLLLAGYLAAVIAVTGPIVGLLWVHWAPKLSLAPLLAGSEVPFKSEIGADAWFLLLAAVAGVITGLAAYLLRARGPGAVLGLVIGGGAAAGVAARVGYLVERSHTVHALRAKGVPVHASVLDIVDFKVRALGVCAAWPLVAVLAYVIVIALREPDPSLP